ncbi:MAG: molybdopterin-guanine dinucleotide biosynthesis protein B [Burkholderiaceae bacterium]
MRLVVFCGYSGAGKTSLIEQLIALMRQRGERVSVIKHAHHRFDVDHEGKDSWRHRQAGAFEVLVASDRRLALMREFEQPFQMSIHQLAAHLYEGVDWVLAEGFRDAGVAKVEVWRGGSDRPRYPDDPYVVAIASDGSTLPEPTLRPVLDLNDAPAVLRWLTDNAHRFDYDPATHAPDLPDDASP